MSTAPGVWRVVLVFGPAADGERSGALSSESSELAARLADAGPTEVGVISLGLKRSIAGAAEHVRLDGAAPSPTDRVFAAIGARTLQTRLARSPLGRLLNSLGPIDPNRVMWRAVRRDPAALQLLASADIVVAVDLSATKTAWVALRRGWASEAIYDHRAASVGLSWHLPPN